MLLRATFQNYSAEKIGKSIFEEQKNFQCDIYLVFGMAVQLKQ